jgi:hypothetical protein
MAARRGPDPHAGQRPTRTVIRAGHGDEELGLGDNPLDDLDSDDPVVADFYAPTLPPAVAPPPTVTPPTVKAPPTSPPPATTATTTTTTTKPRASRSRGRQPLAEGRTFRLVTFSFYEDDVARLDALLKVARQKGHRRASRSQIVRQALRQVDLDKLPDEV